MNLRKDHSHECFPIHSTCITFVGVSSGWRSHQRPFELAPRPAVAARSCGHRSYPCRRVVSSLSLHTVSSTLTNSSQLSAMDASARTTMKGAAKWDKHCKLQNSANQQDFERILRFRDMPESMPASEPSPYHALGLLFVGVGGASLSLNTTLVC